MKKLLLSLLIFTFTVSFAQEKRIDFTKKLNYKITFKKLEKGYTSPDLFFQSYVSKNKEFFTLGNIRGQVVNFYTENNDTQIVNLGLNNRLNSNNAFLLNGYGLEMLDEEVFEQKFAASKLNTSETILGIPCNNYLLKPIFVDQSEVAETANIKACINENYAFSNVSVLSSIFNSLETFRKVDFNISGLILKMGPEKTYNEEHLVLESINDSKDYVLVNYKKLLADHKKVKDSIAEETKKWQKLYSDSAVATVDSVAAINDDYLPKYKSTYKIEPKRDTINLAIDNEFSKHLFKSIPNHCTNIDKELPKFEMKDLDYHVKNYVGQMCDMYLTQSFGHTVAIKTTLDEIRREALFLLNIREKLSDKDRKKLDKYLDNLD